MISVTVKGQVVHFKTDTRADATVIFTKLFNDSIKASLQGVERRRSWKIHGRFALRGQVCAD
jgi:hypothetical protein